MPITPGRGAASGSVRGAGAGAAGSCVVVRAGGADVVIGAPHRVGWSWWRPVGTGWESSRLDSERGGDDGAVGEAELGPQPVGPRGVEVDVDRQVGAEGLP